MSEAELVERARTGDDTAWERLVRQHQAAAFRLAYLIVGSAADAEDVAQEAFIRAFHALERFDTARPLRPWLLRITANLARNRQRSVGRYLAALRRFTQGAVEPISDARADLDRAWEARALWRAMRRLRRVDREVLYLRYFLELSEHESAEVLGVAPGTVKSRTHRALKRLRAVIEREFPQWWEERSHEPI